MDSIFKSPFLRQDSKDRVARDALEAAQSTSQEDASPVPGGKRAKAQRISSIKDPVQDSKQLTPKPGGVRRRPARMFNPNAETAAAKTTAH
jgi:hypothetical protein